VVRVNLFGRNADRRSIRDISRTHRPDLHDVAGSQGVLGDLRAVHEHAVAASEIADDDLIADRDEFRMPPRQQPIVIRDIAQRIAADDNAADEQQLALACPVSYDQLFAQLSPVPSGGSVYPPRADTLVSPYNFPGCGADPCVS